MFVGTNQPCAVFVVSSHSAQGVWRMRQIGKGQTAHLVVVPEVLVLVNAVMKTGNIPTRVAAWLIANSVASEKLQFMQLVKQNLQYTWRKTAFRDLMASNAPYRRKQSEGPAAGGRTAPPKGGGRGGKKGGAAKPSGPPLPNAYRSRFRSKVIPPVKATFEAADGGSSGGGSGGADGRSGASALSQSMQQSVKLRCPLMIERFGMLDLTKMPKRVSMTIIMMDQQLSQLPPEMLASASGELDGFAAMIMSDENAASWFKTEEAPAPAPDPEAEAAAKVAAAAEEAERKAAKEKAEAERAAREAVYADARESASEAAYSAAMARNHATEAEEAGGTDEKAKGGIAVAKAAADAAQAAADAAKAAFAAAKEYANVAEDATMAAASAQVAADAAAAAAGSARDAIIELSTKPGSLAALWLRKCMEVLREPLGVHIDLERPNPRNYAAELQSIADAHSIFLDDDAKKALVADLVAQARDALPGAQEGGNAVNTEIVQEQEQEVELRAEVSCGRDWGWCLPGTLVD